MGLFSKWLGGGKPAQAPVCEPLAVYAPADGTVIPLEEFPDQVFSQGVLGPGCGILPAGDTVTAPFNGRVSQTVDTLHAVGLTSDDGLEVLIHVGVDTVEMGGKGFRYAAKDGQRVCRGDRLLTFDRAVIRDAGHSDAIAVVVTNGDEYAGVGLQAQGSVRQGDLILRAAR